MNIVRGPPPPAPQKRRGKLHVQPNPPPGRMHCNRATCFGAFAVCLVGVIMSKHVFPEQIQRMSRQLRHGQSFVEACRIGRRCRQRNCCRRRRHRGSSFPRQLRLQKRRFQLRNASSSSSAYLHRTCTKRGPYLHHTCLRRRRCSRPREQ